MYSVLEGYLAGKNLNSSECKWSPLNTTLVVLPLEDSDN